MVKALVSLVLVAAIGALPGISWKAPTLREDGSKLKADEIAGYNVYWGFGHGDYQNTINLASTERSSLIPVEAAGIHCAVVTTIDRQGRESLYGKEVCVNGDRPKQPFNIRISQGDLSGYLDQLLSFYGFRKNGSVGFIVGKGVWMPQFT